MSNIIDKVQGDLQSQYVVFRMMMWVDLLFGCLFAASGNFVWAFNLVIVGLILGQISNAKLMLLNQLHIEEKLDVLLEEGVK